MIDSSNRYCLPIQQQSLADVRSIIVTNSERYRFFELWIDLIEDLNFRELEDFIDENQGRLVVLFRRPNLDEIQLNREDRDRIIEFVADKDVYLDLDIATQDEDLEKVLALRKPFKTILSYHNYNYTPSDDEIERILERMDHARAHINKISTFCRTEYDALRLLKWCLDLRKEGKSYIMLGMGEHGAITRVFGSLWGNALVFAPNSDAQASAPGQLNYDSHEKIFSALKKIR
jgi:3-dehydroquinate dehydratase type I